MIGGLAIAIVAIVTSIALLLGSDSDSSTGAIVSSPPPPSPQPSSSSPQPPPSLPQPPAPTLPTRGETTQTEAPLPPDDLESECNGFQVDHRWAELAQCAAKLTQIAPQRAEALKARAARELETAPHIEAVDAALRDRDLRRASEALGQVWADSLELPELKKRYAAAETQAAAELAGRLGRVMSPTCTGYQELLTKERNVQLPSIITEATRFVPCTPVVRGSCNAKALAEQGRARHSAGKLVPALWSYEASWYCQIDPQTAKRGFIVACNIPNAQKAKQFWKRMSAEMRPTVAASCVNNRITEQQLNAP
jgi:hypothetical protein